jgi:hypothetical protein
MQKHLVALIGVPVALALGAYWYWSPYIALREMREAARTADAAAFNAHVDYPKLRESLKSQLSAMMRRELAASSGGSEEAQAGAELGGMLGLALVDSMVDGFVRPETVMLAMKRGEFKPGSNAREAPREGGPAAAPDDKPEEKKWHGVRKGANQITLYSGSDGDTAAEADGGFVMVREGFAQWKLTEIRLPAKD